MMIGDAYSAGTIKLIIFSNNFGYSWKTVFITSHNFTAQIDFC